MPARRTFALLYACSGAAGLIYEIVWTRLLSLQLGHTVAAVGTVLAAFMGGLAAGAVIGGSFASRLSRERALRAYAALECVIALCAAAVPFALQASSPLFAMAYGDEPALTFSFVRLASCLLLVFVPAVAIGATFPLAIRWFVGEAATAGREAGSLYALNTIGAAFGALVTGFVLVPAIGLRATTGVGMALNALAAGGAWLIANRTPTAALPRSASEKREHAPSRPASPAKTPMIQSMTARVAHVLGARSALLRRAPRPSSKRATARPRTPERRPGAAPMRRRAWLPAAMLGVAGFVALVFEVAFTRVLAIALGPTIYAFAAMLTGFISGLAIGAALASRRQVNASAAAYLIGLLMLAVAAAGWGAAWFAGARLPLLVAETVADSSAGPSAILARQALYGVFLLLPLSAALGALFPLAITLAVRGDDEVAHDVSLVYGLNTIGAVAGSLAAAFVLVPSLGLQQTIRLAGLVAVAAGALMFLASRLASWQRGTGMTAAIAAGALLLMGPRWDLNLLAGGGYKYASEVRDLNLDLATGLKAGSLLYYKEGASATVSVRRLAGTLALAIDGKVDASNGTDMLTQKLLAHLPLLLHPNPRRVGIIGLGSGVTAGSALLHGIERADVIEISPEVVEASSFFSGDNGRPLQDPRVRLIVSDGRTHLQLTSQLYDVIISEPSNPWMAGVASLFTREFFAAARARLAPGGVVCQWAHTYDITDADLRSIAATFASVFPNGTMWLIGESDLLFIATNDSTPPRLENMEGAWQRPGVAADLARTSVFEAFSVLSLYVGGPAELQRYGQDAFVQTDDRTTLEFSGPLGVYAPTGNDHALALRSLVEPARAPVVVRRALATAGAPAWSNRGYMFLKAHAYSPAYESFSRSLQLDPDREPALAGLIEAAASSQQLVEARRLLESWASVPHGRTEVRAALARLLAAMGAYDQAAARAQQVAAAEPGDPRGLELLASILADAGDVAQLGPLITRMQQDHPGREETWHYAAMLSFLTGNFPEAIVRAERVVQMNPRHALALNLIGSANATLGQRERARQAFHASLDVSPQEPSTYANLGLLEMESGNRDAAVAYFAESLTLDPHHEVARTALAEALAAEHDSTPRRPASR